MIRADDFEIVMVQASGFAAVDALRPPVLFGHALREWDDVYDGETISLPTGLALPPDAPVATVKSRDNSWEIAFSARRINLFWRRLLDGPGVGLEDTLGTFAERLQELFDRAGVPVGRLAAVVHRGAEKENPGRELATHFCRDELLAGPLNRPGGFELHAHKVYTLVSAGDLQVNSWVRAKTALRGEGPYRFVALEQDINTLEEERERRTFAGEDTRRFFDAVGPELDSILRLYFPTDSQPRTRTTR